MATSHTTCRSGWPGHLPTPRGPRRPAVADTCRLASLRLEAACRPRHHDGTPWHASCYQLRSLAALGSSKSSSSNGSNNSNSQARPCCSRGVTCLGSLAPTQRVPTMQALHQYQGRATHVRARLAARLNARCAPPHHCRNARICGRGRFLLAAPSRQHRPCMVQRHPVAPCPRGWCRQICGMMCCRGGMRSNPRGRPAAMSYSWPAGCRWQSCGGCARAGACPHMVPRPSLQHAW